MITSTSGHSKDHGQSQTGALACVLGREKGFKDPGLYGLFHSVAVVGDTESAETSRSAATCPVAVLVSDEDVLRGDAQCAAVGHGVPRIDTKVDQYLVQVARVRLDGTLLVRQFKANLHILAEEAGHHLAQFVQVFVEIMGLRLHPLATAEHEQLEGQVRRAQYGLANLLQIFANRRLLHVAQEHIHVEENDTQLVVEVMGNATCQLPHGLHFLRLQQLFFQLFAFGYVAYDPGEAATAILDELADGQVRGELRTILSPTGHLSADANDLSPARALVAFEVTAMLLVVRGRHQQRDILADDLVGTVA
jgi:hypothetical protein